MKTTIKQALQALNERYGETIFSDAQKFKGVLKDVVMPIATFFFSAKARLVL